MKRVKYRLLSNKKPALTIDSVAEQRGVSKEIILKAILLRDKDFNYVLACLQGNIQLDTRALSNSLPNDWRRLFFASDEEIYRETNCVKGAVSPLGIKRDITVIFDLAILNLSIVNISSGDPIAGIELSVDDLISVVSPHFASISIKRKT